MMASTSAPLSTVSMMAPWPGRKSSNPKVERSVAWAAVRSGMGGSRYSQAQQSSPPAAPAKAHVAIAAGRRRFLAEITEQALPPTDIRFAQAHQRIEPAAIDILLRLGSAALRD